MGVMTVLLTTTPEVETRENVKNIVGVSTSNVFPEDMAAAEGLERSNKKRVPTVKQTAL